MNYYLGFFLFLTTALIAPKALSLDFEKEIAQQETTASQIQQGLDSSRQTPFENYEEEKKDRLKVVLVPKSASRR